MLDQAVWSQDKTGLLAQANREMEVLRFETHATMSADATVVRERVAGSRTLRSRPSPV